VVLRSLWWEMDAVPGLGVDAQSVLNRQLVDNADILVALFHSRLGAPTARSASGTGEEIDRAVNRGIPVHVYFAEMPYPYAVDSLELDRLRTFRLSLRGLYGKYSSNEELAAKVRTAMDHDVAQFAALSPSGHLPDEEQPRPSPVAAAAGDGVWSAGPGTIQRTLGRNMRALRQAEGVSQEAFAALIGVHRTYLGGIEVGLRNLTLSSVERLAERLGVTPFDLLQGPS
jgi:DNA-binding XRE family transcriptional regulator